MGWFMYYSISHSFKIFCIYILYISKLLKKFKEKIFWFSFFKIVQIIFALWCMVLSIFIYL